MGDKNKTIHAMLIDDHLLFLDSMTFFMHNHGIRVTAVSNARAALTTLEEDDSFDVLLVDKNLPGLDGLAFLQSLNQRGIKLPAIIVSADDSPGSVFEAIEQGAKGYLPKSVPGQRIVDAIHKVLKGGVYIAPELNLDDVDRPPEILSAISSGKPSVSITNRQREILKLVSLGNSNKDIALVLDITEATVKSHLNSIFRILNVRNRTTCIKRAREAGLL